MRHFFDKVTYFIIYLLLALTLMSIGLGGH